MNSIEKKILNRVSSGNLEVEDILDLSINGNKETSTFLHELKESSGWSPIQSLSEGEVPFEAWATVVEVYLKDGFSGLTIFKNGPYARFVVALLEHLHSTNSVEALVDIFSYVMLQPEEYTVLSDTIVSSLNVILSFPPDVILLEDTTSFIRDFIHRYISVVETENQYAVAICALRKIGNEKSINLIKSKNKLTGQWLGTEKIVIKEIRKISR
ncbi:hypothetical protein L4174_022425 [Photobacterium sp. CCB-ST2H9]|uniref:hypothetical protein n=1 Tax=Photobacterium sp. CCB-ST2H9 TaxID=2912855 RepID=UPI00200312D3|nr:hypothetical protein [Photobacterium sp. CCB-ST2H9]UTM59456.1 hypothetical protein L4174_022425 [Photobacterium sp. CCB-ST2H9]